VLVVDDDELARVALANLLRGDGFVVSTAASGEAALAEANRALPDVVLTDLQMPGIDGVELCQRLHQIDRDLPVIVMTAFSDMQAVIESLRAGAQDYLLKPLEYEVVSLCVKRALAQRRAALELDQLRRHTEELYRTLNERLVLSNVREQEHAEAEARQRTRLNTLLENLSEGVAIVDPSGSIWMVNDAARAIFGFGDEDVHSIDAFQSLQSCGLDDQPLSGDQLPLARALRGEQFTDYEVRYTLRSDEQRTVVSTGTSVRDEDGSITLAIVVFRDVTRLRRLEEQREEYLALISHDLRNPLSNVLMCSTLLKQGLQKEGLPRYASLAERAERNIAQATEMLDELSESTSLELHGVALKREECDLTALVSEVVGRLDDTSAARVKITSDGTSRPFLVLADAAQIGRVVTNLLTNALKYSAEDAPVLVRLTRTEDRVDLEVIDRGIGIAPESLKRLFDRYYRAAGGRARASGLGLGLYIVRLIAEAQGGRIGVCSEVGKGSTFRLSLPSLAAAA
jgi:PAS domain S-box-containing protein